MNKDVVILVPIYDPDEKITNEFLKELEKKYSNIVYVNDGSNKKFDGFFEKLEKKHPVIKHAVNLGKGRAIKNGINYILNNYPKAKAMITADCDGQHAIKDIDNCLKAAIKNPDCLILGCRDFSDKNVPTKSKFGNILTRNILNFFVGKKVTDTQTGLRAMSLDVAKKIIDIAGERYDYENNMLILADKLNIKTVEVVIDTIYIEDNKTSHFNPLKDSARIYKLFARFIITALIAYIIECIAFSLSFNINGDIYLVVLLGILIGKAISSLLISFINKYLSILYSSITIIIETILLLLLVKYNISLLLIKIIIDLIVLIVFITNKNMKIKY